MKKLFCLSGRYRNESNCENGRKWGKHIQDDEGYERLADELQTYPCLYQKGKKGYKERDGSKFLGEQLSSFKKIFMNNEGTKLYLKSPHTSLHFFC